MLDMVVQKVTNGLQSVNIYHPAFKSQFSSWKPEMISFQMPILHLQGAALSLRTMKRYS